MTLTGSEPAGRAVASSAAAEVKKAVLELGGSDPFIVMPSADLDGAVKTAVTARTQNNGQSCIAGKRFIVHADVYDAFAEKFAAAMAALKVGDPLDEATQVGPVATASGRDELAELVDDARAKGARDPDRRRAARRTRLVLPADRGRRASPPTCACTSRRRSARSRRSTRWPTREEAIEIANDTTFGLSSAAWTTDAAEQELFSTELEAGGVFLNGMTISYPELPFGGIKNSGYGRELAAAGIKEFCNLKTVWKA